jgi:hypothetical protein
MIVRKKAANPPRPIRPSKLHEPRFQPQTTGELAAKDRFDPAEAPREGPPQEGTYPELPRQMKSIVDEAVRPQPGLLLDQFDHSEEVVFGARAYRRNLHQLPGRSGYRHGHAQLTRGLEH